MRSDAIQRQARRARTLALGIGGRRAGGRPGAGRRLGVRLAAALALTCALLPASAALAYWSFSTPGGSGAASAATVGQGATPSASAAAKAVTVSWSASTLSGGHAVGGYTVRRYEVGSETVQSALAGCAGTITATTCTEAGVPEGQWQYTVTPVFATNWQGRESAKSAKVTIDTTPPSGGSVTYTNGWYTTASVSVSFTPGSDSGSGIATESGLLQRASAPLAAGSCGSYGEFATIASNPSSPYSDTGVSAGSCYQYRYLISNNAGDQATYTSANVVKLDTSGPINALSLSAATGAYLSGSTLYYKSNAAGSFKLINALADPTSGAASTTFPAIATTGWTHAAETVSTPAGGPFTSGTYSWSATPTNPSGYALSGLNGAGLATSAPLTFTSDTTAPTGGGISYTNGVLSTRSVPLTLTAATDSQSGVNAATAAVKRDQTTLNTETETCGTFPGTYATTVTLVAGADTSVSTGYCYKYEYLVADNVGNQATFTSTSVAKVNAAPKVTAIASQESGGGAGEGQLKNGSKLILTFSKSLSTASVPTSFTAANETRASFSGNVTLTIPGITGGALDTGSSGYVVWGGSSSVATFNGTVALVNNGASTTVTITVSGLGGAGTAASHGTLVFTPASTIQDSEGDAAAGTLTTSNGFKLF
jgi:hypothetical protein